MPSNFDPALATAADYADAMLIARSAKRWLFLLLLLILLAQLTVFFLYKYEVVQITAEPGTGGQRTSIRIALPATSPTTLSVPAALPTTAATVNHAEPGVGVQVLRYLTGLTDFLGVALTIVLSMVLLLIVTIMLVGRLIGVAKVTSAYIWALVLAVLLFPWQAFLDPYWFKIPGVLYTWDELTHRGRWADVGAADEIQRWARFVGFPVVAIAILLAVHAKSNRGIREALGEARPEPTRD